MPETSDWNILFSPKYKGESKSFWTGHLEQELQMVQLYATRCAIL